MYHGDYEAGTLNTALLISAVGTLFTAVDRAQGRSLRIPLTGQHPHSISNNTVTDPQHRRFVRGQDQNDMQRVHISIPAYRRLPSVSQR